MVGLDEGRVKRLLDFLKEIDKVKKIERRIYHSGSNKPENDAEHSWHVAMFLMMFDKEIPSALDRIKMLKMILIHDIVEIYSGDTFAYDEESRKTQKEREKKALIKLASQLPEDIGKEFKELVNEFNERETEEAKYVKAFDEIQPLHQNIISGWASYKKHNIPKERIEKQHKKAREHSMLLRKIYDLIMKEAKERNFIK